MKRKISRIAIPGRRQIMNRSISETIGLLTGTRVKKGIAKKRIIPNAPLFKASKRVNIYDAFLLDLNA